jgi:hypothetical protein
LTSFCFPGKGTGFFLFRRLNGQDSDENATSFSSNEINWSRLFYFLLTSSRYPGKGTAFELLVIFLCIEAFVSGKLNGLQIEDYRKSFLF